MKAELDTVSAPDGKRQKGGRRAGEAGRKTAARLILALVFLLCACVFPLCLVRQEANVDPVLGMEYGQTLGERAMRQSFTAQSGYLSRIAFDIEPPREEQEGRTLRFRLRDSADRVVFETDVALSQVKDSAFTFVDVHRWVRRGAEYSYELELEGTAEGFRTFYTEELSDAAAGSGRLFLDGKETEGQAVTRYVYRFPLGKRNILCLWAFFAVLGLTALEFVWGERLRAGSLGGRLTGRLEELLEKWQLPVLLSELALILFFLVGICRNEAVDWDEAFTWRLVTKCDLAGMIGATARDVHPPLYYMMAMAAVRLFGENIFVLKLVSVAGAAATGLLGVTLVRRRWGVKTAALFLLAAGLGPQMIYYNVYVRMYSWLCFFVLGALLFAYEIIREGRPGQWAAFTALSLCGVYTQYFAVVPLGLTWLFLLIWLLRRNRAGLRRWLTCAAVTVLAYLPWLFVVIDTVRRDAAKGEEEKLFLGDVWLKGWAFGTGFVFSEYMPVVLLVLAVLCLAAGRKERPEQERYFVGFTGLALFLSYGLCMLLTLGMNHFWSNRYLVDVLLFLWLFLFIALGRRSLAVWSASLLWLATSVSASYGEAKAMEMNTVPWLTEARKLLEQVEDEERIVYTFPTFDVLYEYFLPDAEFVWYEDVDFAGWGGEFYVIAWGGGDFYYELYNEGLLHKEILGEMRLEEGVTAQLWRITVDRDAPWADGEARPSE